jgi:hypothetical protein
VPIGANDVVQLLPKSIDWNQAGGSSRPPIEYPRHHPEVLQERLSRYAPFGRPTATCHSRPPSLDQVGSAPATQKRDVMHSKTPRGATAPINGNRFHVWPPSRVLIMYVGFAPKLLPSGLKHVIAVGQANP